MITDAYRDTDCRQVAVLAFDADRDDGLDGWQSMGPLT